MSVGHNIIHFTGWIQWIDSPEELYSTLLCECCLLREKQSLWLQTWQLPIKFSIKIFLAGVNSAEYISLDTWRCRTGAGWWDASSSTIVQVCSRLSVQCLSYYLSVWGKTHLATCSIFFHASDFCQNELANTMALFICMNYKMLWILAEFEVWLPVSDILSNNVSCWGQTL